MHATTTDWQRPFVPGMGVDWLLPLYDPFTKLLGLDATRRELVSQANLRPRQRVLDIGCGTGSLAILIKRLVPDIDVVGLDPDPKALARAAWKARRAGVDITFERGFSDALHHAAASFDRVFSSLMFHHLEPSEKARTLCEIRRVLKTDGSLHLLDFGGPDSADRGSHLPGLRPHRLTENDERTILALMRDAGLTDVTKTGERLMLKFVRVVYYRAGQSRRCS